MKACEKEHFHGLSFPDRGDVFVSIFYALQMQFQDLRSYSDSQNGLQGGGERVERKGRRLQG
jgi:hypothetical protein